MTLGRAYVPLLPPRDKFREVKRFVQGHKASKWVNGYQADWNTS